MPNKPCRPERELRRRAREEIQKGRLPESPTSSIWGGLGSGLPCAVCGDPIRSDQVEYEMADPGGGESFRFHLPCHMVWQFECAADTHGSLTPA
jgi:hypothetical protein